MDFQETEVDESSQWNHLNMRLDYIQELYEDIVQKVADTQKWYEERLDWWIHYYRGDLIEFEERLKALHEKKRDKEDLIRRIGE